MAQRKSRNALLAREIRAECARQQISGRELSRRTGVPERTVARYLRGETNMSLDDIEGFAAALGMSTVDLVMRAYDGSPPPSHPTRGTSHPNGSGTTGPRHPLATDGARSGHLAYLLCHARAAA